MSKHIKVELDFIPVEERLPGDELRDVQCVCYSPVMLDIPYRIMAGQFVRVATDVTHWAEIPAIKEAPDATPD